ncbi:Alpha/beta hydrolase fold-3 [Penicillium robsamsonii]|uniref:Alpha/beta hydrolase fold-3 n=1 Tax=Penicillium robsamsonii TaxID=1792511 RepID=UPI0025479287|nr:Alpha/beta hydrolase fold-3 [Penicillium robsamsonii]KAJ5827313.1 Alpha/beta hydrolase fold-3 [Penicillium robsamsonii]
MARSFADDNAIPNGWRTRYPGSAIWIIIAIFRGFLEAFFYSIYYIPSSLRQSSTWTYRQACMTRLLERVFHIITEIGFTQSLSLKPEKLGDRWVTIDPAPASAYSGDFTSDTVKPETVGGTWYPNLPSKQSLLEEQGLVVLSFHSGSLLWLTGRPEDSEPTATLLNNSLGNNTRSFWLQYRLAGGSNPTPYPGAMQDAVTAYIYLTKDMGISPSRIVLAGDSTGSTIAVALLRYLASIKEVKDHELAVLPPPKACLLFSPSVEYCFEGDPEAVSTNRNIKSDYVEAHMMAWGARAIAPPDTVQLDDPYISPALHPFATTVPIFVQAGGAEVLADSVRGFANAMSSVPGNVVEHLEVPDVPHDVYVVGTILGWPKEQKYIHEAAARFVLQ